MCIWPHVRMQLLASVPPCIHLYTINGLLLLEKELAECVNAMVIIDKYLITGNTKGFLTFRNLFRLVGKEDKGVDVGMQ